MATAETQTRWTSRAAPASSTHRQLALLGAAGVVLVLIGVFSTWVAEDGDGFGNGNTRASP